MPHSPYTKTIHPPIDDENLRKWNEDLRRHRARWDREEEDSSAEYDLLEIGEFFSKHIEFLATKLDIEKRELEHLAKENKALEKENEVLEIERDSQKRELAALTDKLAKERERRRSYGTENGPKRVDSRNTKFSRGSSAHEQGSNGFVRPPKRGAEIDPTTYDKTAKKWKAQ